ncbi:MAG: AAA family ATPase [DPANN group archaeon]|nr:AAA family ATPase [DPANN group archaeon]
MADEDSFYDDDVFSDNPEYNVVSDSGSDEDKLIHAKTQIAELKAELMRYKIPPLLVGEVIELLSYDNVIVRLKNGNEFSVFVDKALDSKLVPGDEVLLDQKSLSVVQKIGLKKNYDVNEFVIIEKPNTTWKNIGGLKQEIIEIKEVIELPLTKPELFKEVGIEPPKGILLYGPPGTGKTLLAKAVANSTNAVFIEIVGSELVQKFIGQGAKLVKSIFQLARDKAPAIIFIDEIDAIASKRIEVGTSGEREVQRTFMQLLAEIDGFKSLDNVKVIGATNRIDILDSAVIRPGRLDRILLIPEPDKDGRKAIFEIHTKKMTLDKSVDSEIIVKNIKGFTGAEIRSVCVEAGYFAIRENRKHVFTDDFLKARDKVLGIKKKKNALSTYID